MKFLTRKTSLAARAVSALALIASPAAHAALIAYEGFDYTEANGTSISGLNGGTGWTEAYPSVEGTIRLDDGLSFTGHFASAGKSMERLPSGTLTADGRNWAATVATGTYWYSFLMNPEATGRGTLGVLQGAGSNQNGFGIRFDPNSTTATTLQINANTPAQAPGTNILFENGYNLTYLVLGRLTVDTAANTINDIWVYQNGTALPTSASALGAVMSTSSGATGSANPAMYGRAFGNPNAPVNFDEVRIGTTFDAVMIPEPSAAALGLLGLLGFVRRRR